jgi:Late embryogenesis abundant protein.
LFYLSQLYDAARSLVVKEISVADVSLEGFNPPGDLMPDAIHVTIYVSVHNPSMFSLEVERFVYTIYVKGSYLGEGVYERIYIPAGAERTIYLYVTSHIVDVLKIIADMIMRGDTTLDYEVKGYVRVPVKLFGVVYVASVDVPFDRGGTYQLPYRPPLPSIPRRTPRPDVRVNAYWERSEVRVGEAVAAVVEVWGPVSGVLEVVVKKDFRFMPDEVAYVERFTVDIPPGGYRQFRIIFIPSEASGALLRGYFITVKLNKVEIWTQPQGYPPRLKVLGR